MIQPYKIMVIEDDPIIQEELPTSKFYYIGLFLCKRLCNKLGIGLSLHSGNNGTTDILSFHINHFLVQG